MAMRLSGLMSGMDTESIIKELVAVKQTKVDDARKAQTKLSWKQDAWKTLNTQTMKLYNGTLSNLRFQGSYMKKTTKVSNSNAVSVITGENAVNSVQSLKIGQLARSAYMTGGKLEGEGYTKSSVLTDSVEDGGLGLKEGSEINLTVNGESTTIEVTEGMTVSGLTSALQKAGVNASFDEKNQRFFISSKATGAEQGFTLVGANSDGVDALDALGISTYGSAEKAYYETLDTPEEIAAEKTERLQNKLDSLVSRKKELESGMETQMKLLTETYKKQFEDIDMSDMTSETTLKAINDKINDLKGTNATAYKELQNWVVDYQGMQKELDSIGEQLVPKETVNANGETVTEYELQDSVKEEIEKQVDAEAEFAKTVLATWGNKTQTAANKMDGTDAEISLNGVTFTSSNNTFEINGLTMTVNATTAENEEITITTEDDTDGIYDMVKDFLKEYNALVNQMDKLYNADSASDYEPLTDDEKESMSDSAIEEWESKIKDALLRKDSTLSTFSSAMKEIMSSGVSVNGKTMYLSDFGIETLSYFTAADNEKNAYHIDGDSDDANTSGNADKLKSMIASDPDTVMNFFTNLSRTLYTKMTELTAGSDYSSSYTMYDDKKMKEDYDDYTSKISDLEDKLNDYEDKWYSKFASMETALAKLQSNASAVTSLLGGS